MMTEVDARYVIRAVGSRMGGGDEVRKLGNATINNLKRADENNIGSIGLPRHQRRGIRVPTGFLRADYS